MTLERETVFTRELFLRLLDARAHNVDDLPAFDANEVVVVRLSQRRVIPRR